MVLWSLHPRKAILNSVSFIHRSVSEDNSDPQEKKDHSKLSSQKLQEGRGGASRQGAGPAGEASCLELDLQKPGSTSAQGSDHRAGTWGWGQGGKEKGLSSDWDKCNRS